MSAEHDAKWNAYAQRSIDGLRQGGICPLHLKRYQECGCKKGFEDPGPVMDCAECNKRCVREAFINASGKAFPWCIECRRKRMGVKRPVNRRLTQDKYLET